MVLKIVIVLVIIVPLVYFGIGLYIAYVMTKPLPKTPQVSRESISPDSQDIEFQSPDGIHLKGWLFKGSTDKLIIMVPGVYENRVNTPYLVPELTTLFVERGYSVLLYDPRGIGESEQVRLTFAFKDYLDIVGAVNFAKEKGFDPKKIAVIGDSLGATSIVFASPHLKEVGALIADSPASALEPLVTKGLITKKNVPSFLVPGVYLMGKVVFGVDIPAVRPIDTIVHAPERVFLFLHGEVDDFIIPQNSLDLLNQANPGSKRVLFKGANHVETFKTDPELYKKEVFGFLESELGK